MLTSSINSSGTQNNNGGRLGRNRKRRRRLPLFLLILASILVSIFFYISSFPGSNYARRVTKRIFFPLKIQLRSKHLPESPVPAPLRSTSSSEEEEMTCHLPRLTPFDPTINQFITSSLPDVDCEAKDLKLFRTNFESKLIQVRRLDNASCCYHVMERREGTDLNIRLSEECHRIREENDTEIPAAHEFISVHCNYTTTSESISVSNGTRRRVHVPQTYLDMFAFVPLKAGAEERVRAFEARELEPDGDERLSVVILGLDAQSHMNFLRQMPNSYDFLRRNLSAIELHGYTKVGDNTFPNLVPVLTGLSVEELRGKCWRRGRKAHFDSCPFIWKDFGARGYRTSFGEDSVWMGMFNYEKPGFSRPPTDYYLNPVTFQMDKRIGHEVSGNAKLCYGPRLGFEVLLDYIVKTAVSLRTKRYFQLIWANSLFHDFLNHPKLGDDMLRRTLQFFQANHFLNNTLFILMSDHGIRWGSIRSTYQGRLEERLPMAFFVFPPWFRDKYAGAIRNFERNADRLTTPFDLHETLKDILRPKGLLQKRDIGSRGISLFSAVPKSRTCPEAGIDEHWCVCKAMESLPTNLPLVQNSAKFVLMTLNRLLANRTSSCAKLKLFKVTSAFRKRATEGNSTSNMTEEQSPLQITLVTRPGDAIFEATLYPLWSLPIVAVVDVDIQNSTRNSISRNSKNGSLSWELAGDISRLNLYRTQSQCIVDYDLQKFCYCKNTDLKGSRAKPGKVLNLNKAPPL